MNTQEIHRLANEVFIAADIGDLERLQGLLARYASYAHTLLAWRNQVTL
jgi:hypothetical protein